MSMISACVGPSPGTASVRERWSSQRVQTLICFASFSSFLSSFILRILIQSGRRIVEPQTLGIQGRQIHPDRVFIIVPIVMPPPACGFIPEFLVHFLGSEIACAHLEEGTAR